MMMMLVMMMEVVVTIKKTSVVTDGDNGGDEDYNDGDDYDAGNDHEREKDEKERSMNQRTNGGKNEVRVKDVVKRIRFNGTVVVQQIVLQDQKLLSISPVTVS